MCPAGHALSHVVHWRRPAPTFSEHHSFVSGEAGGQGLTAQMLSALLQLLPLERTLSPQSPEVRPVSPHDFMGILDAGHLLCSDSESGQVETFARESKCRRKIHYF